MALTSNQHEGRLVAEMVLNVCFRNLRSVDFSRIGVRNACNVLVLSRKTGRLGSRGRSDGLDVREAACQVATALGKSLRVRGHGGDVGQLCVRMDEQAMVDGQHRLPEDSCGT